MSQTMEQAEDDLRVIAHEAIARLEKATGRSLTGTYDVLKALVARLDMLAHRAETTIVKSELPALHDEAVHTIAAIHAITQGTAAGAPLPEVPAGTGMSGTHDAS